MTTTASKSRDARVEAMRRHHKAVECRNAALPHLDPPGERVQIPYEGTRLYGNHVANNRGYRYRAQSADWMAQQLGGVC